MTLATQEFMSLEFVMLIIYAGTVSMYELPLHAACIDYAFVLCCEGWFIT